jgi:lysophospholipase L1-like esterase
MHPLYCGLNSIEIIANGKKWTQSRYLVKPGTSLNPTPGPKLRLQMNNRLCAAFLVVAFSLSQGVRAESPDPDPGRFSVSIEAFTAWDSKNSFPEGGVLFVGSSSVRLWPTAMAFPGKPIINRGFGGAELSDVIHFYEQVIRPYSPSKVFLYAGDNDIGNGKSADQVFKDYKELVVVLRADLPDSELIFISIKPSWQRWGKWPTMVEANRMVREYAARHHNLGYADLATPLLDNNGRPKDVFINDGLHLSEEGYRLWQEALAPFLD